MATGPSMNADIADSLMDAPLAIVVNDAFRLAPWADAIAATDCAWWRQNPDAMQFNGRKFSANNIQGVERVPNVNTNRSSGVLALEVAVMLGATRIELYGFDMHGSHYFGPHTKEGLHNTTEKRFEVFQNQFAMWRDAHDNVVVRNRTKGSKLRAFPYADDS